MQQQAEPERRGGQGQQVEHGEGAVAQAVLLERRGDADRDADQQLEEDAEEGDHHRRREALQDGLHDRQLRLVRVAEVAVQQVPQVEAVLRRDRLVEPEVVADAGEHRRGGVRAGDGLGGVARHGERQQEGDHADEEEDDDHPEQAPDEVLAHGLRRSAGAGRLRTMPGRGGARAPPLPREGGRRSGLSTGLRHFVFHMSMKLNVQTGWM